MTETAIRHIPLDGVKNFRDMGGYKARDGRKVCWGRLMRSGHLSDMTEACGTEMLARDIETVIDFRTESEKAQHPVRWPIMWSPAYHKVPIDGHITHWAASPLGELKEGPLQPGALRLTLMQAYTRMPLENVDAFRTMLDTLIDHHEGNAALLSCAAGKDRVGLASALILAALGVHHDDIMEEYLMTNHVIDLEHACHQVARHLSLKCGRDVDAEEVYPLVGVEPDFLGAAFGAICGEFDCIKAYIRDALKTDDKRLEKLADKFLSNDTRQRVAA